MMTRELTYSLAGPLVLMQFLAIAWRVNREIHAPDDRKQGVIALPDVINIMSLFATIAVVIVLPTVTNSPLAFARAVLGSAYMLIAFHPLCMAAHYRLWRRNTDWKGSAGGADHTLIYANPEELAIAFGSSLLALAAAVWIEAHASL